MSFDAVSYIMGKQAGAAEVELTGTITCTDDGDGNVEVTVDGD